LPSEYDPEDKVKAFEKSLENHPFPIGVIYKSPKKGTLETILRQESNITDIPLYKHQIDYCLLSDEMDKYI
jgi:hypothetical protein